MRFALIMAAATVLLGCVGYSNTSSVAEAMTTAESEPYVPDAATTPATSASAAPTGSDDAGVYAPEAASADSATDPLIEATDDANLMLGRSARFDGYLMDRQGQPLYMFAEDIAGTDQSACLGVCQREWPAFDVRDPAPGAGIIVNEVTRFHRQDGSWQTAFKGHPLYYRASEAGARDVTGDGIDGRWFVARDYLTFLAVDKSFAPAGSDTFGALFLTNGFGRTLYVCLDDTPGDTHVPPLSSCLGECVRRRPVWSVSEASRTVILPSVMSSSDIGELVRPDGAAQLLLRGWPVYYFSGDESSGDTQGQNQDAWRAIDPTGFGQ